MGNYINIYANCYHNFLNNMLFGEIIWFTETFSLITGFLINDKILRNLEELYKNEWPFLSVIFLKWMTVTLNKKFIVITYWK